MTRDKIYFHGNVGLAQPGNWVTAFQKVTTLITLGRSVSVTLKWSILAPKSSDEDALLSSRTSEVYAVWRGLNG
jgi:hypothetical protein